MAGTTLNVDEVCVLFLGSREIGEGKKLVLVPGLPLTFATIGCLAERAASGSCA